jgi:hypothetical protein
MNKKGSVMDIKGGNVQTAPYIYTYTFTSLQMLTPEECVFLQLPKRRSLPALIAVVQGVDA